MVTRRKIWGLALIATVLVAIGTYNFFIQKNLKRNLASNNEDLVDNASETKKRKRVKNRIEAIKGGSTGHGKKGFVKVILEDLESCESIDVKIRNGEKVVSFKKIKGINGRRVSSNLNYWYGEDDSSTMILNLLQEESHNDEIRIFGSMVEVLNKRVHQIFPNINNETEVLSKFVWEYPNELPPEGESPLSILGNFFKNNDNDRSLSNVEKEDNNEESVDILVLWSHAAECANSGLSNSCVVDELTRKNMRGKIKLAIEETNAAYSLSGIQTQLRLVFSYRAPSSYVEHDIFQMLDEVTKVDDILDDVHEKRTKFGADLVSFVVDTSQSCGVGWIGPSKDYTFSVVSLFCMAGHFSLSHETAHNFGCDHDRFADDKCDSTAASFGYKDPQSLFRTIMAYNCNVGFCNESIKDVYQCSRVQRYANIHSKFMNLPIGNDRNNCGNKINTNRHLVASYYPALTMEEISDLTQQELLAEKNYTS